MIGTADDRADAGVGPGMIARWRDWLGRRSSRPVILLVALMALSVAARGALLGQPCRTPCRSASDHLLVFDEAYYVNAARVIAGIRPPPGSAYAKAPLGDDPNGEHPQLAKLIVAGSIELFGDGPFAWRLGSLVFGTVAILGMFALVRAAGGDRWLALGAAALMAFDNLQLVHGRIDTLDVYALAAMVWAVVAYLRDRPVLAGLVIGVGACAKEVAPYALLVVAALEVFRWQRCRAGAATAAARVSACVIAAAGAFIGLLAALGRIAPPYADAEHQLIGGGAFGHLGHILSYAAHTTSPHGPTGIASYPWEWLFDYKPIPYLTINPARPAPGLYHVHPAVHFLGMISPAILLVALPGLVVAALGLARRGQRPVRGAWAALWAEGPSRGSGELGALSVAWFLSTFVPFELQSLVWSRTSYLYYMVIVMPGLYLAAVYLMNRIGDRRLLYAWTAVVVGAAIVMYPFTPLPS